MTGPAAMDLRCMYLVSVMQFIAAWHLVIRTCKKMQVHVGTNRCLPRCMHSALQMLTAHAKAGSSPTMRCKKDMNLALRGLLVGSCWGMRRAASTAVMSKEPERQHSISTSQSKRAWECLDACWAAIALGMTAYMHGKKYRRNFGKGCVESLPATLLNMRCLEAVLQK